MKNFLIILIGLFPVFSFSSELKKSESCWLIAHTPDNKRLVESAIHFSQKLEAKTNGRVKFKIVFPKDRIKDGNNFKKAMELINSNECQVSQIGVTVLSERAPIFGMLDMPYLFQSHQHAAQVFDGEIGKEIKNLALTQSKNIRPLAFTYSGGFRVMATNKQITSEEDLASFTSPISTLADENIQTHPTVRYLTLKAMSLKSFAPKSALKETDYAQFTAGQISFSDDHYGHFQRVLEKYNRVDNKITHILESNHSLFLTSIVVNEQFYQSLSKEDQVALEEEAQALALTERVDSIQIDQYSKKDLIKEGVVVTVISPELKAKLIKKFEVVYKHFEGEYGAFIKKIIALKN